MKITTLCRRTTAGMYRWLLRLKRTTGGSVFLLLISIYFLGFSLLEIPGIAITLWQAGRGFVRTRGVPQDPGCPGPACQQDLLTLLKGAVQGNHSQQQLLQDQFGISLQTLIDNAKPRVDLNKTLQAVGNDSAVEKGLLQSDNRTTENTTAVEEEFFYYVRSKDGSSRQISGKHPVVKIHQDVNLTAIMEAFHHPWNRDDTSLSLTRSELEQCCSSRKMALMTQENYAVGQRVPSAFNLTQFYTLTEKIHNLLRKKSPFPEKLYKTCSVVGNSGVLRESNCADHIDGADYVFRCNMPPLNDKRHLSHVGTKSNFTTVPMSMLRKYGKIEKSQELKDRWYNQTLQYEGMVIIKKPKDSTAVMQAELEKRRTDLRVAYEDPAHFIAVQKYWAQRGLPRKITSGFYVITVALMLCEQVNVYGFWPFPFDDSGGKVRYHYYYAPIFVAPETHDMAVEFMKVRELHQKGVIKMQLGKCQDKKPVRKHRKL
ncbi:alpha-N-acetylneuraminide alpha-2,8-sialyltransferase-like isoform X2 [Branchiostoma floridae]|uniref:Alpha-N-acetylneuraminide alpha-2,8-sialyltransferase-like isoform X2 n=1 Tax=Branchiostoma floridae TaxID=7739 RepID=A0A9J7N8W3_BRAFL|nr:alpha-N-acetylneuraminide alpha-2,8-sialyltransferase-like isoform X2 [Branchiostoma floridae]